MKQKKSLIIGFNEATISMEDNSGIVRSVIAHEKLMRMARKNQKIIDNLKKQNREIESGMWNLNQYIWKTFENKYPNIYSTIEYPSYYLRGTKSKGYSVVFKTNKKIKRRIEGI